MGLNQELPTENGGQSLEAQGSMMKYVEEVNRPSCGLPTSVPFRLTLVYIVHPLS